MWEIVTYGGGDFLRMIFSGIAMIFGNADYKAALQCAALIGFIGILIYAAFQKGALDIKWLIGLIMIVMLLIVPKVNLVITDRVVPANSAVVANVPLGLGLTATAFSKIGDWMTRSFETVFALPNEVRYSGNGLLFASHLVEESTRFEITTPRVAENFAEFWKSCVYYDLTLNLYTWDRLLSSSDLMSFLADHTSQTRSFTYQDAAGNKSIMGCRTGLKNELTHDLDTEIANSTDIHGVRLVPDEATKTAAVARFAATLPVAYRYLTGLSMSSARIIGQNVLANSLKRGLSNFANEADASAAAQDFALARAEQERRTTFSVMGKLAKRMLPILHNIFEAFIYAIFPLVMLMAMLPVAAKVLLGYTKALFWINLWAPLYAVLHFAMSVYGQHAASAAVVQAGGGFPTGLTVLTHTGLGQALGDYAAIAGYLSLSIPLMAWMMVSQSGAIMAGLAGRMMQSYDHPVAKAADEASTGNVHLGNTRYETHSAFQSNTAPSDLRGGITVGDGVGNTQRTAPDGGLFSDVASSTAPLGIHYGAMATTTARGTLSEAASREEASALRTMESNAALRSEIDSMSDRVQKTETGQDRWSESERHAFAQAHQKTEELAERFAEQNGIALQTVQSIQASLGGKLGLGGKEGLFSAGVHLGGGGESRASAISKEDYSKVVHFLSSDQYSEALRDEGSVLRDNMSAFQLGTQDTRDQGLNAALNHQHQASLDHSEAVKAVAQASKQLDYARQLSAQIQAKGDDAFFNWLADERGLSDRQIHQLINDANQGDLDAIRHRDTYAGEYVNSELGRYAHRHVSEADLDTRAFVGNARQRIENHFDTASGAVNGQHQSDVQAVKGRDELPDKAAAENKIHSNAISLIGRAASPNDVVIMTPLDNGVPFKNRGEEIQNKVEDQLDEGVIDRAVDAVKGWFR